jgi:uncharacterized protein (DUF486 family)
MSPACHEHAPGRLVYRGLTAAGLHGTANRIGHQHFSAAELKTIQEVITLVVFCFFSIFYLREELKWNYLVGFSLIIAAVFFIFKKW